MKKKFLYSIIFLLTIVCINVKSANAIIITTQSNDKLEICKEENQNLSAEEKAIKRVSFKEKFQRSPEAQIEGFYKKFNKYSEKNEITKLKEMYSDSYLNNDGMTKDTLFKMMEDATTAYKNIKYTIDIKEIKINGDYASVRATETATGETTKNFPNLVGNGSILSEITFTDNLQKVQGKWKINSTVIEEENVTLKYGRAKIMQTEVYGPNYVVAGTDYDMRVKMTTEEEDFVVGSIANEKIKYPQEPANDKLKAVKYDELSRILKANTEGYNEYATISLAITQANVEPDAIIINMQGIAILMHRVNVLNQKTEQSNEASEEEQNEKH